MTTLIVIGGTGELGCKTVEAACAKDGTGWDGEIIATYNRSAPRKLSSAVQWIKLDCGDHKSVRKLLASQTSLGAVAYCAVPKHGGASGKGGEDLFSGIVSDVENAAEAVAMIGARFVAISTDVVFDGKLAVGERYVEDSATNAGNAYAEYKVAMEQRLLGISGKVVIARTSLILTLEDGYVGKGVQFVLDCINGKHGEIELFTDELRNASFADDLGRAVVELAKPDCAHTGLIHLASDEVTNRWELAKLLAKKVGIEDKLGKYAKSGLSVNSGMNRPTNCALSSTLRKRVLKTNIRSASERLGS